MPKDAENQASRGQGGDECFVISPIGAEGSPERLRADKILRHVIRPCASACGFEAIRADNISDPGLITTQVIQRILEAPLVIADLTGRNPNVFYELALRHAVRKPVVQICQAGEQLPFDVAGMRTVFIDHTDLDSVEEAKVEIEKHIRAAVASPDMANSPLSTAIEVMTAHKSGTPSERLSAEVLTAVQQLSTEVATLKHALLPPPLPWKDRQINPNVPPPPGNYPPPHGGVTPATPVLSAARVGGGEILEPETGRAVGNLSLSIQ